MIRYIVAGIVLAAIGWFAHPDPVEVIGATAICQSGAVTTSTGKGVCSGHGGVKVWLPSTK